jgi:hypothetical protein
MIVILDGLRDMLRTSVAGSASPTRCRARSSRGSRHPRRRRSAPPASATRPSASPEAHALAENLVAAILVPESTLALSAAAAAELGC